MVVAGCTDAADVPTTIVHVHVAATCDVPDCTLYSEAFNAMCGPDSSTMVTERTRGVEVLTATDADDIAGYIQVQYASDFDELAYTDHVLTAGQSVEVYGAYDYALLYRVGADGAITDIDTSHLVGASGNALSFEYSANGVLAKEDHAIDAPREIRVETDDPGIMDACCSAGRPGDAGLIALAIIAGATGSISRRRSPRRSAWPRASAPPSPLRSPNSSRSRA
jgi:hypothetical protein